MTFKAFFIAGPTASGKSSLALMLAKEIGGALINVDSMQVYTELRVLSARPSVEDEAIAPHYLYGHVPGREAYDVARFTKEAMNAYRATEAKGLIPIFVGGTGLYMKALLEGLATVPDIQPEIRQDVRALGAESAEALYNALQREDPIMAARLNVLDRQRVARALEVLRSTGKSLSVWQAQPHSGPLSALNESGEIGKAILLPERVLLYDRCNRRFDLMVEKGAIDEVQLLQEKSLDPSLPVMRALGVPPLLSYLEGESSLEEAAEQTRMETRRFAKRQNTWLRNQFMSWNRLELKDNNSYSHENFKKIINSLLTAH